MKTYEQIKDEAFGPSDAEGWRVWEGGETMRPAGAVDLILRNGRYIGLQNSGAVNWKHGSLDTDVVKWRQA